MPVGYRSHLVAQFVGVSARSVRPDGLARKYLVSFWVEYHGFLRTIFDNEGRWRVSLLPSPPS